MGLDNFLFMLYLTDCCVDAVGRRLTASGRAAAIAIVIAAGRSVVCGSAAGGGSCSSVGGVIIVGGQPSSFGLVGRLQVGLDFDDARLEGQLTALDRSLR